MTKEKFEEIFRRHYHLLFFGQSLAFCADAALFWLFFANYYTLYKIHYKLFRTFAVAEQLNE